MASDHWHDKYNAIIEQREAEMEKRKGGMIRTARRLVGKKLESLGRMDRRDAKVLQINGLLELHEGVLLDGFGDN